VLDAMGWDALPGNAANRPRWLLAQVSRLSSAPNPRPNRTDLAGDRLDGGVPLVVLGPVVVHPNPTGPAIQTWDPRSCTTLGRESHRRR